MKTEERNVRVRAEATELDVIGQEEQMDKNRSYNLVPPMHAKKAEEDCLELKLNRSPWQGEGREGRGRERRGRRGGGGRGRERRGGGEGRRREKSRAKLFWERRDDL